VSYADEVEDVLAAAELLAKEGISCDVYKLVRIFPFEEELIRDLSAYPVVLMAEECVACGGIGEHLARALQDAGWQGRYIHCACLTRRCLKSNRQPGWMPHIWPRLCGKQTRKERKHFENSFGPISGAARHDPEP